ncbi:MAG: archaellin/type IV pilin N-terminal domain-containing protein [Candidatus Pacearchaeota archaeon]
MNKVKRRGLSPVIATVLLVSLVVILGVVIFLWARSVIPEVIEKNGEAIENACAEVQFEISYVGFSLSIENIGNIPIYGVEIYRKTAFGKESIASLFGGEYIIKSGERREFSSNEVDLSGADEIVVIPILLGTDSSGGKTAVACDEQYGQAVAIGG